MKGLGYIKGPYLFLLA